MTRRENRRSRRAPVREERTQVLVVCGGKATEPDYFRGLKKERRNPAVRVIVEGRGVDPMSLIRFAAQKRDNIGCDEVWCVIDVDEFDVAEALAAATKKDVKLAIPNPCFEYWLLLHFELCATPMTCFDDVQGRLVKRLPRYNKSKLCFADLAPGVDDAIERAEPVRSGGDRAHPQPLDRCVGARVAGDLTTARSPERPYTRPTPLPTVE
jgi:hypothetical protein